MYDTSRAINLSDLSFELFDHSFEYDKWSNEPGVYICTDSEHCGGKIQTERGYWLDCMSNDCLRKRMKK
jgi:hypothetical protein